MSVGGFEEGGECRKPKRKTETSRGGRDDTTHGEGAGVGVV
jgi:hypothetical protein